MTLTGRDFGLDECVPMIGFPYHASDMYLKKISEFHDIVLVDEGETRKIKSRKIIDRETGEVTESEPETENVKDLALKPNSAKTCDIIEIWRNFMEIFDKIGKEALKYLQKGDGWMRRENDSNKDIEVCGGIATADEKTNTCELCVALNRTVFKNYKKAEYQHPYCKCNQTPYSLSEPDLDFPIDKITYLFTKKRGLTYSWGYLDNDIEELYQIIAENAKSQFMRGNYILGELDVTGQQVSIIQELPGKRLKQGRVYRFYTGWMAYPNGKLHNNTPFCGWVERT